MPINVEYDKENGYSIVRYIGQLTDIDMKEAWKQIFKRPDFSFDLNELTDVSEIDASKLTSIGLRELAKFISSNRKGKQSHVRKVAIFAPDNVTFGLARVFEGYDDERIDKVEVFKNLEDAKKFLADGF